MDEHTEVINNLRIAVGKHGERLQDLERYNLQQNGAIVRIEQKVDDLGNRLSTKVDSKFDALQKWMLDKLVAVALSFGVFVLGLVAWLVQRG